MADKRDLKCGSSYDEAEHVWGQKKSKTVEICNGRHRFQPPLYTLGNEKAMQKAKGGA